MSSLFAKAVVFGGIGGATVIALLACSATTNTTPGAGGKQVSDAAAGSGGDLDGGLILDVITDGSGGNSQVAEVFGHSATRLYRLDPDSKQVSVVGDFSGCNDSVIDIALDRNSQMIGTTFSSLVLIDKTNAKCTLVKSGSYPNSLSYVPAGVLDPNNEVLVGYNGASYVRIDTSSGQVSTVGQLAGGYQSSGDIVSVQGGSTYLTVSGNECGDCLFEVDPTTGAMIKNWGKLGYADVYGIAFWGGAVYGFDNGGDLFEIDFNGNTFTTQKIATGVSGQLSFWGAGSTTVAPIR